MTIIEGKKAYTVDETAALMGVINRTVRQYVNKGYLHYEYIEGNKYILEDDIKECTQRKKGSVKHE